MIRLLLAFAVVGLSTVAAVAASPKVNQAIRVFNSVGYNQYKLTTYCQMSAVAEAQGEREDEAAEAALEPYIDRLGPDFEEAWETNEETDENSSDGKQLAAAVEALDNRCPDDGADDGDDDGDDAADAAEDADDAADAVGGVLDALGND